MPDLVTLPPEQEPADDFAIVVEPESEAHHQVVEFDRHHARFVYGPRSFASQDEALRTACRWAEQYGIGRVYLHGPADHVGDSVKPN